MRFSKTTKKDKHNFCFHKAYSLVENLVFSLESTLLHPRYNCYHLERLVMEARIYFPKVSDTFLQRLLLINLDSSLHILNDTQSFRTLDSSF